MLGAIIGDMVGSSFEGTKAKDKDFDIYNINSRMSDDSRLTLSVIDTFTKSFNYNFSEQGIDSFKEELINGFKNTFIGHPNSSYGEMFIKWCLGANNYKPYGSFSNGGAMRVSPVSYVGRSLEEVKLLSKIVTEVTHNHSDALKGAEAIAVSIFLALNNKSKEEIKNYIKDNYYPSIDKYNFNTLINTNIITCEAVLTCPIAIYIFLVSSSFEDTLRNACLVGIDTDTIASMASSIAYAYYHSDEDNKFIEDYSYLMIDPEVEIIINKFNKKFLIK